MRCWKLVKKFLGEVNMSFKKFLFFCFNFFGPSFSFCIITVFIVCIGLPMTSVMEWLYAKDDKTFSEIFLQNWNEARVDISTEFNAIVDGER